jgi:hypothetical protein
MSPAEETLRARYLDLLEEHGSVAVALESLRLPLWWPAHQRELSDAFAEEETWRLERWEVEQEIARMDREESEDWPQKVREALATHGTQKAAARALGLTGGAMAAEVLRLGLASPRSDVGLHRRILAAYDSGKGGCKQIARWLKARGVRVSHETVRKVLLANGRILRRTRRESAR